LRFQSTRRRRIWLACAAALGLGARAQAGIAGPLASADQNWWACELRSTKPSGIYGCSGVLVDAHTVLTAKHCLTDEPITALSVWCGGSWVDGAAYWIFPDTSAALDSDIALVKVAQNFWYSPQYAPRLPDSTPASDALLKKSTCAAFGFGVGPDGQSEYLRWQSVADLNKGISPHWMSNSPQIIAHGDSGGPVVCVTNVTGDYTTAGKTIVAINTAFAYGDKDWMLRIDPYRDWICANIAADGACALPSPTPTPQAARKPPELNGLDPRTVFGD
jgi:hypothetical protein